MAQDTRSSRYSNEIPLTGGSMKDTLERENMGKEERKALVLEFMDEYDIALPPKPLFRGLRFRYKATFGYTSLRNYLDELQEDGLVLRVDPEELEMRNVVEVEAEGRDARTYYLISDAGREHARNR